MDTALKDFQGEKRPHNASVLPAESQQIYVYIVPAQTVKEIYPLGGNVRYLISPDGSEYSLRSVSSPNDSRIQGYREN